MKKENFEVEKLKIYLDNSFETDNFYVTQSLIDKTLLAIESKKEKEVLKLPSKKRIYKIQSKVIKILASVAVLILFFVLLNNNTKQDEIIEITPFSMEQETIVENSAGNLDEKAEGEGETMASNEAAEAKISENDMAPKENRAADKRLLESKEKTDMSISNTFSNIYFISEKDLESIFIIKNGIKNKIKKFSVIRDYFQILNQYNLTEAEFTDRDFSEIFSYQLNIKVKTEKQNIIFLYFGEDILFIKNKNTKEIKAYKAEDYQKLKNAIFS